MNWVCWWKFFVCSKFSFSPRVENNFYATIWIVWSSSEQKGLIIVQKNKNEVFPAGGGLKGINWKFSPLHEQVEFDFNNGIISAILNRLHVDLSVTADSKL